MHLKREFSPWICREDNTPKTKHRNRAKISLKSQFHESVLLYFELMQSHAPDYEVYKNTGVWSRFSTPHKYTDESKSIYQFGLDLPQKIEKFQ